MAVLSEEDRQRVWRGLMRFWSGFAGSETCALSKAELRAAVDATDTWIDNNQASYNTALPQPARDNLNMAQKTVLFCVVAAMRVGTAFARALVGSMD